MSYLDSLIMEKDRSKILLLSPAKINLYLRVLDKRPDGYHNLENLMQTISFCDEIEIHLLQETNKPEISLECDNKNIPAGIDNIAVRAARNFIDASGIKNNIHIKLRKKIPMGAGLGGGSSNAGTVLMGLNLLSGNLLSMDNLTKLAIRLGSDVPFFLYGGLALCTGKGEKVKPLSPLQEYWIALVNPGILISTKEIYELFVKFRLTYHTKSANLLQCGGMQYIDNIIPIMCNDLEEIAMQTHPRLREIKSSLENSGCLKAMVTGSGSTVFGLCRSPEESESICSKIRKILDNRYMVIAASNL
jgi:4-diphosphocytidyl-2-C-methyl-D-erythritol kinase